MVICTMSLSSKDTDSKRCVHIRTGTSWYYYSIQIDKYETVFSLFVALTLCSTANYYVSAQPSAYIFRVTFVTDNSVTYSGFKMNFYLGSSTPATTTTPGPTTQPPGILCIGFIFNKYRQSSIFNPFTYVTHDNPR